MVFGTNVQETFKTNDLIYLSFGVSSRQKKAGVLRTKTMILAIMTNLSVDYIKYMRSILSAISEIDCLYTSRQNQHYARRVRYFQDLHWTNVPNTKIGMRDMRKTCQAQTMHLSLKTKLSRMIWSIRSYHWQILEQNHWKRWFGKKLVFRSWSCW